jgi:WD40 repeat protein
MATLTADNRLRLWDMDASRLLASCDLEAQGLPRLISETDSALAVEADYRMGVGTITWLSIDREEPWKANVRFPQGRPVAIGASVAPDRSMCAVSYQHADTKDSSSITHVTEIIDLRTNKRKRIDDVFGYKLAWHPVWMTLIALRERGISYCDVDRSQPLCSIPSDCPLMNFAISPNGLYLALLGERQVELLNFYSGQSLASYTNINTLCDLCFSSDSKKLSVATTSGQVLIFELENNAERPPFDPEANWRMLASDDLSALADAMTSYSAHPVAGAESLVAAIKRVQSTHDYSKLFGDLGSDDFAIRDQSQRYLAREGILVSACVAQHLKNEMDLERKERLVSIRAELEKGKYAVSNSDSLRAIIGMRVLESLDTQLAIKCLSDIADTKGQSPLTDEAKCALLRVKARKAN